MHGVHIKKRDFIIGRVAAINMFFYGEFYISSGLYEKSFYQISDSIECINNPRIKRYLDKKYFAEGMTPSPYGYYLLTWKENIAFLFDNDADELIKIFNYEGEGWGIDYHTTTNLLYMTNGSNKIYLRNPETFEIVDTIEVFDNDGNPVELLNELEVVDEYAYINQRA